MNFGEMLSKLRAQAQLTQAALADKAGLSLRTVQAWEQGRRSPVSPDFFKLVKALGAPCEAFADCDGAAGKGREGKSVPKRGRAHKSGQAEASAAKRGKRK
jgi:transcriptional regulator with XRE-family HTH domain